MNEIKIYLKPSGSTAELDKDFNLYQGSYRSVQITIFVPTEILYKNAENSFYNLVQTAAIMTTPNGAKVPTKAFNAAFVKTVVRDGVEYAEYTQVMPKEYALYAGTQTIVCNVANIDNTTPSSPTIISVVTTQRASLVVLESAYLSDNVPLDPSDAEIIEGLINDLQQRLNDGTFAARAIYAWNSVYKYGAGELAFYPDRGEYGAFIKSLVADNVNLPYVDGELNSEYWKEIADFNILNELYGLKGDVIEAVEKTAADAASAKQSANTAADLADAAATSAQTALSAAESVQDTKVKIDEILDGTTPVPKAISDSTGANIAEHFGDIEKLIPSTTTAENQLADKAFVNSSINNMAAFYITSTASGDAFSTRDDLLNATEYYYGGEPRTPTQNDYAIVLADESQPKGADGNYPTTRYTYQGGEWAFQYVVNNTSLTQAQVDAINSGITKELVAQIGTEENSAKNLYNLGVYDTFVSNGDGTVTITRKTGYINLNGSEPWETWATNYGQSAALFITPIPCVISAIGAAGQISAVANGFEVRDENYTWGAQHSKAIAFEAESEETGVNRITVSIIGINSGETAKQYFSETHCYIQYELENPYTETVIENQPIHTLNQDGEQWVRNQYENSLNLSPVSNKTVKFARGTNRQINVVSIPLSIGKPYRFSIRMQKSSTGEGVNGYGGCAILQWNSSSYDGDWTSAYMASEWKYENPDQNISVTFTATHSNLIIMIGIDGQFESTITVDQIMVTQGTALHNFKPYKQYVNKAGDTMTGSLNFPTSEDTNVMVRTAIVSGQLQGDNTHGETERQNAKAHSIELGVPNRDYVNFNEHGGDFRFYKTGNVYYVPDGGDGELVGKISADGIVGTKFVQLDPNKEYVDLVTGIGENFGVNGKGGQIYNLAQMLRKNDFYTSIKSSVSVSSNTSANINRVASVTATNNSPCLLTVFGVETAQHGALMISSNTSINSSWSNDNNNGSNILAKTEGEQGYWSKQYLCCSVLIPPNQTAYVYARYLEKIRYTLQPVFSL